MTKQIFSYIEEKITTFLTHRIRFIRFAQNIVLPCLNKNAQERRTALIIRLITEFEEKIGKRIYTDSFTIVTSKQLLKFLEKKNYRPNTIRHLFDTITTILYMAKDEGFRIKNKLFREKPKFDITTKVYLTEQEILKLYVLPQRVTLNWEQQLVLDIFLVGCYTALRYSDLITIRSENIINQNILQKKTQKTKEVVSIPLHPVALAVLKKYDYDIPTRKYSMQYFNSQIKNLCRMAEITQSISIEYVQGGQLIREVLHKYELISSHSARRTAITNLYLKGMPILSLMLFSGHKNLRSLLTYIQVTKEVHMDILSRFIGQPHRLPPVVPKISFQELNQIQLDYLYHALRKVS